MSTLPAPRSPLGVWTVHAPPTPSSCRQRFAFPRGGILAECLEMGPGDWLGGGEFVFLPRGRGPVLGGGMQSVPKYQLLFNN